MKKWILMASMMLAAGTMTACSEDDGPNDPVPDAGSDTDGDGGTDTDGETTPVATCFVSDSENPGFGEEVDISGDVTDADDDNVCDSEEAGLSNSDGVACDTLADCDGDGISDAGEFFYLDDQFDSIGLPTSPNNANTDDAGADDLEEFNGGLDPTNPADNVDLTDNTELFEDGNAYSYVSGIGIAGADCCFSNLDGDSAIDNDLAALLNSLGSVIGAVAPDLDLSPEGIAALIGPIIEEGTLTLLFEHTDVPVDIEGGTSVDVGVQPYIGELAGDPVADLATRQLGNGEYFLGETVGSPFSAIINDGQFLVNSGALNLSLDLSELAADLLGGAELVLDLNVQKLRVRGDVSEQTEAGITDALGVATDTNLEVGGALPLVELLNTLNGVLGECFGGADLLVVDTESNDERIALACTSPVPEITDEEALGGLCGDLADFTDLLCGGILDTVLGENISVDTDDDGKADGLALGLTLELSGAADIRTPEAEEPVLVAE